MKSQPVYLSLKPEKGIPFGPSFPEASAKRVFLEIKRKFSWSVREVWIQGRLYMVR